MSVFENFNGNHVTIINISLKKTTKKEKNGTTKEIIKNSIIDSILFCFFQFQPRREKVFEVDSHFFLTCQPDNYKEPPSFSPRLLPLYSFCVSVTHTACLYAIHSAHTVRLKWNMFDRRKDSNDCFRFSRQTYK